jgi:hypothetical protein
MAGNYPDVPGPRMAYDVDGSVGFYFSETTNLITQLTAGELASMNDEDNDSWDAGIFNSQRVGLIFPELRDILGYFMYFSSGDFGSALILDTSTDTTNGLDGTWTTRAANWVKSFTPTPGYRTGINTLVVTGIKAIRFQANRVGSGAFNDFAPSQMHIYGAPNSGASIDRLVFWDPTSNVVLPAAALDWGNVPRSSSADKTFRVKNVSTTKTAQGIVISPEALTDTSPSVPGQHLFSTDGTTFTASINIGDLAPGATSSVLYVRRVTPSNAVLSVWTFRAKAVATAWV